MTENATERAWVLASPELLREMANGWSRAVRIRAYVMPDGRWELSLRAAYNERGELVDVDSVAPE